MSKDFDFEKREKKQIVDYFSKQSRKPQVHEKYAGQLQSDSIWQTIFYPKDTAHIVLSSDFLQFQEIFLKGLVSSHHIYCVIDSLCRPVDWWKSQMPKGNFFEHVIYIDYLKELDYFRLPKNKRRYMFWVHPGYIRMNGANLIFFIELTNDKADKKTETKQFIKDARLTFIGRASWIMI